MRYLAIVILGLSLSGCYSYSAEELKEIQACTDSGGAYHGTAVLDILECDHGDQAP